MAIPLNGGDHWHSLSFDDHPANEVSFSENSLKIGVKGTSSPLFYHFDETAWVRTAFVDGVVSGLPAIPTDKTEGEKGADDFALRFGVVLEGTESLNWFQRLFAPGWLKRLGELFPGRHFGSVEFLTLAQRTAIGTRRQHPMNDALHEEVAGRKTEAGPFTLEKVFSEPQKAMGLWIQSDGDDTRSSFDVTLRSITLTTVSPP